MLARSPKKYPFFLIITLVIFALVGYLGYRTIAHQALLKRYQTEQIAQSHLNEAEKFINNLLVQKATRLEAIANFLEIKTAAIEQFTANDSDVEDIFILQQGKLFYPNEQTARSQKQQLFFDRITPLLHDLTLLYNPNIKSEQTKPQQGWYINYNNQIPLFIYWYNKDQLTIGFSLYYTKLLSDVINHANFNFAENSISIIENDRVLYQSNPYLTDTTLIASKYLTYPLTHWQINYYGKPNSVLGIYLWGTFFILLLLLFIGLILYRLYKEYMHTAHQAIQQINFVSQVSHELKTPLTNITLYAELLKEDQEEHYPEGLAYSEVIINESQRLSRLIQNILSFTKAPKIHLTKFNLSEQLNQIAQTFAASFNAKGIKLVSAIPDDIFITSDIDRVTQIIYNFLSNAEKYAVQGKQVDLSILEDDHNLYIKVRDYGSGIAAKEQKRIFQPFYRVKSSLTEGVSGTGIGLTIAKQLANSLQGDILVTNLERGVCFTLRLNKTGISQLPRS